MTRCMCLPVIDMDQRPQTYRFMVAKHHNRGDLHTLQMEGANPHSARLRETASFKPLRWETNPQVILHISHTGKNRRILSIFFKPLNKSKDLERVKGIEPSS
jgi:hypothetical protein